MISLNPGITIIYKHDASFDTSSEIFNFLSDDYSILHLSFGESFPHKGKVTDRRVDIKNFEDTLSKNLFRVDMVIVSFYNARIKERHIRIVYKSLLNLNLPCFIISDKNKSKLIGSYIRDAKLNISGTYKTSMRIYSPSNFQNIVTDRIYKITNIDTDESMLLTDIKTIYIRDKKLNILI